MSTPSLQVHDRGRMPYRRAYELQQSLVEEVLAKRAAGEAFAGHVVLLEHDPVVTVSGRAGSMKHLLASPEALARDGIEVAATDRGGDITYHGPGQLVAYPILDLNLLNLGLHDYMRLLETAVIGLCQELGIEARRETGATGVWCDTPGGAAKLCAMGVRVRRWVSMHGLAINVSTDLAHFNHIVPCGLIGRAVTSLHALMGQGAPTIEQAKAMLTAHLQRGVAEAFERARAARAAAAV